MILLKRKVLLGQNPLIVKAAINVYSKLYEKLTDAERLQLKQLDELENKHVFFNKLETLGGLIERENKKSAIN